MYLYTLLKSGFFLVTTSALFLCCGNDNYCPTGHSWCWAKCVDLANDNDNCGSCDNACESNQTCIDGLCACKDGYSFCNGICADTTTDTSNCGVCGISCKDYETCDRGFCTIIDEFDSDGDGYAGEDWGGDDCNDSDPQIHPTANDICDGRDNNCDGDTDEDYDLLSDPENCGSCDVICQRENATAKCEAGICNIERCDILWDDCNSVDEDGCETSLETLTNCGACGAICSGPGGCITCLGGICSSLDYADCDGDPVNGKETDVCSDEQNCGYCSNECSIGESCIDAVCQ